MEHNRICNAQGIRPAMWVTLVPVAAGENEPPNQAHQPDESAASYFAADLQTGDEVVFGHYEQDGDPDNGIEEIEWLVLAREEDTALLISKYALEKKTLHWNEERITSIPVTWETCALRQWLNHEFMNTAFQAEEQELIALSLVTADPNPSQFFSPDPGNDAEDKVFLLSILEAQHYFPDDRDARCLPTAVLKKKSISIHPSLKTCRWLLRTPGRTQLYASVIEATGAVTYSTSTPYSPFPIRPALRIKLAP